MGAVLIAIASRLRLPSIALLLIGGVALGPEALGLIQPADLGGGLRLIVAAAVAVILFEGGLSLDIEGYRRASVTILRLLSVGALITWAGATAAVWWFLGLDFWTALVAGSLVIVTGPTVVSPLMRRIGVTARVKNVLYWEGVLVDAVGVFLAVMAFELLTESADNLGLVPIAKFLARFAVGAGMGLASGMAVGVALRLKLVPSQHANIVVLGASILTFAVADSVLHEAGILAVIIAGMTVAAFKPPQLHELERFKLELTELGIGVLFLLLAANLELDHFYDGGLALISAIAIVVLAIRPLVIAIATAGQGFSLSERVFLSWVAPRGIVAASMASLFALRLEERGNPHGTTIMAFVFGVIGTTVILQGFSANWLARLLKVIEPPKRRWLVVAPPALADALTAIVTKNGGDAVAVHTHAGDTADAADPLDPGAIDTAAIGAVLAVTADPHLNQLICHQWREVGVDRCYAWSPGLANAGVSLGEPVWERLQPAHLEAALRDGDLELALASSTSRNATRPLLALEADGTAFIAGQGDLSSKGHLIVTRKRDANLDDLVAGTVHIGTPVTSLEEVVSALMQVATDDMPGLPIEALVEAAVQSEVLASAGSSAGVALPHAYHERVDHSRVYVATVPSGLAMGDNIVSVVLLVLSPTGRPDEHLRALASVARFVSEPNKLTELRGKPASHVFPRANTRDPAMARGKSA